MTRLSNQLSKRLSTLGQERGAPIRAPSEDYLDDDDLQFDIVNEEDEAYEPVRRAGSPYLAALHRRKPLQNDGQPQSLERRIEEDCEVERLTSSSNEEAVPDNTRYSNVYR